MNPDEETTKSFILEALRAIGETEIAPDCRLVDAAQHLRDKVCDMIGSMPANWRTDSSLETWFPLSAWTLGQLRRECENLRERSEIAEKLFEGMREFESIRNGDLVRQIEEMKKAHPQPL